MFWSLKPIILKSKTYHFADQNNLFCSSDVSDDTKKFITLLNNLIVNALDAKVTFSGKLMVLKVVQQAAANILLVSYP